MDEKSLKMYAAMGITLFGYYVAYPLLVKTSQVIIAKGDQIITKINIETKELRENAKKSVEIETVD